MFAFNKKSQPEPKKSTSKERRQNRRVQKNFILKYFDMSNPKEKYEITQLKNISQIEHTRHRSVWNFMVNILGGLAAYSLQPKKPSLNLSKNEKKLMIPMAA